MDTAHLMNGSLSSEVFHKLSLRQTLLNGLGKPSAAVNPVDAMQQTVAAKSGLIALQRSIDDLSENILLFKRTLCKHKKKAFHIIATRVDDAITRVLSPLRNAVNTGNPHKALAAQRQLEQLETSGGGQVLGAFIDQGRLSKTLSDYIVALAASLLTEEFTRHWGHEAPSMTEDKLLDERVHGT